MSPLLRTVAALPSTEEEEPYLGLISVFAIALGGQGSSEDRTQKARAVLLRTTCEHLLLYTASDGSPCGGLQHMGPFIVLPFPLLCP